MEMMGSVLAAVEFVQTGFLQRQSRPVLLRVPTQRPPYMIYFAQT